MTVDNTIDASEDGTAVVIACDDSICLKATDDDIERRVDVPG